MANIDFQNKIKEYSKDITSMEQMLGSGLLQPFNGLNSGSRKIMYSTHRDHIFPLISGEKAIIETGYEIKFGDYSSAIVRSDSTYKVIGKVSKFSFAPNHHYWLLLLDENNKKLDILERISYCNITEGFGYLYNNEYLDCLDLGDIIPNKQIVKKSVAFDEFNNRKDGINFNVLYCALDDNMEDSIIICDKAADRLVSPLIHVVSYIVNDNNIPLNIYGNNDVYKVMPDIGEDIIDGNLMIMRTEKKEEALFNQSVDRLKTPTIADEAIKIEGKVIDVDIFCNNPDNLDLYHYSQFKMYYSELQRSSNEIYQLVLPYVSTGEYKLTYDLQKKYSLAKRVLNKDQYIFKKPFSNLLLYITVLEEKTLDEGDKLSNRYGGKGVVSCKVPENRMPKFLIGDKLENVDIIFNSGTMVGRENIGQIIELELTHIGCEILTRLSNGSCSLEEGYQMVKEFISCCSVEHANYMDSIIDIMTENELAYFMEAMIESGAIHLSIKPISETMTIDIIADIYAKFPWIEQNTIMVPIESSSGETRWVPARRKAVVGKEYIFRLKQFAREKLSATSLSATNIKNENTKSKTKKNFRELFSNTCIRFGNMETNNKLHAGADIVIANLMIHSLSPQGRRLVEQMYTDDPFDININLNSESKNRLAEIVNTYMKTLARRIKFSKYRKKYKKITMSPVSFKRDPYTNPVKFKSVNSNYDYQKKFDERNKFEDDKRNNKDSISPITFEGIDRKRSK